MERNQKRLTWVTSQITGSSHDEIPKHNSKLTLQPNLYAARIRTIQENIDRIANGSKTLLFLGMWQAYLKNRNLIRSLLLQAPQTWRWGRRKNLFLHCLGCWKMHFPKPGQYSINKSTLPHLQLSAIPALPLIFHHFKTNFNNENFKLTRKSRIFYFHLLVPMGLPSFLKFPHPALSRFLFHLSRRV